MLFILWNIIQQSKQINLYIPISYINLKNDKTCKICQILHSVYGYVCVYRNNIDGKKMHTSFWIVVTPGEGARGMRSRRLKFKFLTTVYIYYFALVSGIQYRLDNHILSKV